MKKKSKPSAILTSDWHIRGDRPVCRTDDYKGAQKKKINFILNLADQYKCPILEAGDLGHRPMWGDPLLNWTLEIFNNTTWHGIYVIAGQHDLPNHRLDKWSEGGLGVLHKKGCIRMFRENSFDFKSYTIHPFHYSEKIDNDKRRFLKKHPHVALIHCMVIKSQKDKLWQGQEAHSAKWFLKKFQQYDLIVTGDNHQSFAVEYEGRWLVNCGSIMRMTADQIEFRPRIYLWYAEENIVEPIYLPIEKWVISREHIEDKEKRDERIESYLEKLNKKYEVGLNYEKNLEEYFKKNRTRKGVERKVWGSIK